MLPFEKTKMSLLISSAVFALSSPAFAQSDTAQESVALEEIVVTATKRSESASKVPFNISAIGQQELKNRNIVDIKSLIADSVEISAPANSARFADSVSVRGLNVSSVNANNLEGFTRSTLAYYLDDTPLPNMGYRIKDIARVETLLGPQGTLYGSGSLGGTVRYITNQPVLGETTAEVNTAFYQTNGGGLSSDTDVVVNLPISDTVAIRGSIAYLDEAGFTDRAISPTWRDGLNGNPPAWSNPNGSGKDLYKDDDYQRATTGRIAIAWAPTEELKFTLTHAQQSQLAHGTSGTSIEGFEVAADGNSVPQYGQDVIVSRYEEYSDRDFTLDSLNIEWDLGWAALNSSTSYFEDSRIGQADYAGQGDAYYGWIPGLSADGDASAYMTFDNTYSGLSHETRLVSTSDSKLSWIAGLYYTTQDKSNKFSEWFPTLDAALEVDDWLPWSGRDVVGGQVDEGYAENLGSKYEEVALFGELSYAITERWDFTLGARVFNYSDEAVGYIVDYAGEDVDSRADTKNSESGKKFFKLNTSYDLTDELLAYATASQGFRRGGVNGFKDAEGYTVAEDTLSYDPDQVNNYELGIKGYFFDKALFVQTSVYQMDWQNVQTYFSQGIVGQYSGIQFPVNGTANGPDARTRGWELSSRYQINDEWSINYATATTEAEWSDTKTQCVYGDAPIEDAQCRTWAKGGALGGSPEWRHNLGVKYNTVLDNGLNLWAGLRGSYTSDVVSDRADDPEENLPVYGSYTLYSANLGLSGDQWDTSLWIQNLTDERAQVSNQRDSLVGRRIIQTMPRTIGVNLSYNW